MMNWNTVLRSSTLSPTLNSIYNARTRFVYCDVGVAASIASADRLLKFIAALLRVLQGISE